MNQSGFWYAFGRFMYKCFHGLEWTYQHLSPNKVFIAAAFICFIWWMVKQHRYNKQAAATGGYK